MGVSRTERMNFVLQCNNMQITEAARLCGVTDSEFTDWLKGSRIPTEEKMKGLAEYCHVDVRYLLGQSYTMTVPVDEWRLDLQEDYERASTIEQDFYGCLYGRGAFLEQQEPDDAEELLSAYKKLNYRNQKFLLSKALELLEKQEEDKNQR